MELGFVYFPLKFQSCDFSVFTVVFWTVTEIVAFLPLFKVTVTAEADCFTFSLMLFTFNGWSQLTSNGTGLYSSPAASAFLDFWRKYGSL